MSAYLLGWTPDTGSSNPLDLQTTCVYAAAGRPPCLTLASGSMEAVYSASGMGLSAALLPCTGPRRDMLSFPQFDSGGTDVSFWSVRSHETFFTSPLSFLDHYYTFSYRTYRVGIKFLRCGWPRLKHHPRAPRVPHPFVVCRYCNTCLQTFLRWRAKKLYHTCKA